MTLDFEFNFSYSIHSNKHTGYSTKSVDIQGAYFSRLKNSGTVLCFRLVSIIGWMEVHTFENVSKSGPK